MQLNPAGFQADVTRKHRFYIALQRLRAAPRGIISLDFLKPAELAALRAECGTVDFRRATAEIAHKGRRVHQDFDVCLTVWGGVTQKLSAQVGGGFGF